jgi:hypothetical protein
MGALTVGADDVSNILVVSCKEELFDGIVQTVRRLDMESAPQMSFVVHPVSGSVTAANLGKAMTEAVGRPWLGRRPEEQAAAGGARGPQGENRGGNNNQPPNNNRGRNARPAGASR